MQRNEIIELARKNGATIEAGKQPGTIIYKGTGGITFEVLERTVGDAVAAERSVIKKALLDEAGKWCGDHKISAWRALCDAAKNMGIELTQKECYAAMRGHSNVELTGTL